MDGSRSPYRSRPSRKMPAAAWGAGVTAGDYEMDGNLMESHGNLRKFMEIYVESYGETVKLLAFHGNLWTCAVNLLAFLGNLWKSMGSLCEN